MHEARIEETPAGKVPADNGWFVLNVGEIAWASVPGGGTWCSFESDDPPRNPLGIGVHVLGPGETPGFYHAESDQEGFLVLSGECLLIVEGEERAMRRWDYFHCPPGTAHITIGAGDEPCAIFMLGARHAGAPIHYEPDPIAAKHGAAVKEPADSAREAYADQDRTYTPVKAPWPGT
jgi:uncharacterized cupin superfamily protein